MRVVIHPRPPPLKGLGGGGQRKGEAAVRPFPAISASCCSSDACRDRWGLPQVFVFLLAVLSATSGAAAPLQLQLPSWLVMSTGAEARRGQRAPTSKGRVVGRKAEPDLQGTVPFRFPLGSAPVDEAEQAQLCSTIVNEARL
jgi:hypothetical protein